MNRGAQTKRIGLKRPVEAEGDPRYQAQARVGRRPQCHTSILSFETALVCTLRYGQEKDRQLCLPGPLTPAWRGRPIGPRSFCKSTGDDRPLIALCGKTRRWRHNMNNPSHFGPTQTPEETGAADDQSLRQASISCAKRAAACLKFGLCLPRL